MSCCGQKRIQARTPQALPNAERAPRMAAPVAHGFQYTGATAMTARGPITGRSYRFGAPGAVVAVDARDAPSLAALPNLRRVA
jgi:hypothetical protein